MATLALGVLLLAIGTSLGLSGLGGFLVPPLLVAMADLAPRLAVTDALISFVPAGVVGAYLTRRQHPFSRRLAAALCLGTVPGVLIGREISLALDEADLQRVLAIAVAASAAALLAVRPGRVRRAVRRVRLVPVALVGCLAGVLVALAGIGGPLITLPALVLLGLETVAAVGISLLGSVVGSGLGALALVSSVGALDWPLLVGVSGVQLAGVIAGVLLRPRFSPVGLRVTVAVGAFAAAAWLLWRSSR